MLKRIKISNKIIFLFSLLFLISFQLYGNDSFIVKVISYNIQTGTHYQLDTPQKISRLLNEWEIDILSTQEIHVAHAQKFDNALTEYDWFGVGRNNGKDLGETSAIFYKKTKFKLIEENTFWLSETPDKPGSKSWRASDTRIVTWGKLLDKSTNRIFYIFNTHYDHISSTARIESSKLLRIKMREIAGLNPIIITGDFNCSENSSPYNILVEDNINDLRIFNSEKISQVQPFGPSGSYNSFYNDNPSLRIDFIFVNQYIKTLTCGIINEKPNGEFISDHFPLFTELKFNFPSAPIRPELKAIAGDGEVNLYWDSNSELNTIEPFLDMGNDFQGYKLYRSKDPQMSDAVVVPDSWDVPLLRNPLMVCDKIDDFEGYTDYGIVDGFGYYLGNNSGLQHFYTDRNVINGEKYYYLLTAFDSGISEIASGFAPQENEFEFTYDDDSLVYHSPNTAVVIPTQYKNNSKIPSTSLNGTDIAIGNSEIITSVFNPSSVTSKKNYKLKFTVDTLGYLKPQKKYRHANDLLYVNNGFKIIDNDSIIYYEDNNKFTASNVLFNTNESYFYLNDNDTIRTEEFAGIQISMNYRNCIAGFSEEKSGWIKGNANLKVHPSLNESKYFPWSYEIVFTDSNNSYTGLTNKVKGIRGSDDKAIGPSAIMLKQNFNFYVLNKSFQLEDGSYEKLDLIINDINMNGVFDGEIDQILVGHCITIANQVLWTGTVFALDFSSIISAEEMPRIGDKYLVEFDRPYLDSDEILIQVDPEGTTVNNINESDLHKIFTLNQNYPNPFNSFTNLSFTVFKDGKYSLEIFNILGQKIKSLFNKQLTAGSYTEVFKNEGLASGVYLYRLMGKGKSSTTKMILIK